MQQERAEVCGEIKVTGNNGSGPEPQHFQQRLEVEEVIVGQGESPSITEAHPHGTISRMRIGHSWRHVKVEHIPSQLAQSFGDIEGMNLASALTRVIHTKVAKNRDPQQKYAYAAT